MLYRRSTHSRKGERVGVGAALRRNQKVRRRDDKVVTWSALLPDRRMIALLVVVLGSPAVASCRSLRKGRQAGRLRPRPSPAPRRKPSWQVSRLEAPCRPQRGAPGWRRWAPPRVFRGRPWRLPPHRWWIIPTLWPSTPYRAPRPPCVWPLTPMGTSSRPPIRLAEAAPGR